MFRIIDIDVKLTKQTFDQHLNNVINRLGTTMTVAVKDMATRQGKTVYRIDLTNSSTNSVFSIISDRDGSTGDFIMKPLAFTNMHNGYYETKLTDQDDEDGTEDPSYVYSEFLASVCGDALIKGTCAYAIGNDIRIFRDGARKTGKLAAVDDSGNLYGASDVKKFSAGGGDEFVVNKPLNQWLSEPDQLVLQTKLQTATDPGDKADLIGKYLIFKKSKGDIDFDEFYDIFRQPGMLIGYKDTQLKQIYELLM